MRDAIEGMNKQNLDGRNVIVNEAQSRESHSGGDGNYGSGGGQVVTVEDTVVVGSVDITVMVVVLMVKETIVTDLTVTVDHAIPVMVVVVKA